MIFSSGMNNRAIRFGGIFLIFSTLLLFFYEAVISRAVLSNEAFYGWLELSEAKERLPMLDILIASIFVAGLFSVKNILKIFGCRIVSPSYIFLGISVLVLAVYIPVLLKYPFWKLMPEGISGFYVNHFLFCRNLTAYSCAYSYLGLALILAGLTNRFRVFLVTYGAFLITAWLVIPVLRIIWPDFYFETSIYMVYGVFGLLYAIFIFFAAIIKPYFSFRKFGGFGIAPTLKDVSPEKGFTVQEISEGKIKASRKKLLFGTVDEALIRQWGAVGQAIIALHQSRVKKIILSSVLLILWPVSLYFLSGGSEGAFDRDVAAMWDVHAKNENEVVSTRRAMVAARRVFNNKKQFMGLDREEALEKIKPGLMHPQYKLNRPIGVWEKEQFIARIGNGEDSYVLSLGYDMSGKTVFVWCKSEAYPPKIHKPRFRQ